MTSGVSAEALANANSLDELIKNMDKINKLIFTLVGVAGNVLISSADTPPHIILIMDDQHRGDALGCMGNSSVITPNLDRLAGEGSVFTRAYTSCPSSTPARAGLLTGLSPWHHGMLGYGVIPEKCAYELPRLLRSAGYFTFGIGKMHYHPQRNTHGFHGTLLDESGRVEDENFVSDYHQWFRIQAPTVNPDLTGIGWNDHGAAIYKLPEKLHPTYWTGEMACRFITNYDNPRQPLFLKISFARPHSPYDPPTRFVDMYKGKDVPPPAKGDWCGQYATLLDPETAPKDAAYGNFGDEYAKHSKRYYYANITFVDEEIGKIIHALKEKNMYDNALILFISDHGDMMGDHYHWRKTYPYEGSSHIPFIVKWPKSYGIAHEKISQLVELRDVLPTFIEAAGGEIPRGIDGKSVLQLALHQTEGWRKYIDMEHATCYSADNYWCAITDGKMKYIWNFHNGKEQLFDLDKDPHELHNVVDDRKYGRQLSALRQAMVQHLSERGEGFVKGGKLVVRKETMLYSPNYKGR